MKTICHKCKSEMEVVHKTVMHKVFNREITVHDVPIYQCSTCDNAFYVLSKKLDDRLDEAFRFGKTEISFEG